MRYSIDLYITKPDSTIPDSIRGYFEDDDGMQLKSFSYDLNGDGIKEKFIPNEFLCGTGLCPWIILDTRSNKVIGEIDAKVIFITDSVQHGYPVLEAYIRCGGGCGSFSTYEYISNAYQSVRDVSLKDDEIELYFKSKKYLNN